MSLVYLFIFIFDIPLDKSSIILIFGSLLTTIGFVTLGYLLNEVFDLKDDILAGKPNRLFGISKSRIILYFIASIILIFIPWIFLPHTNFTWGLIFFEISLFLAYSLPIIKLKKVPIISSIIDTLYAYVVPPLLALHTYILYSWKELETYSLMFLIAWLSIVGFRNILIHQIDDISFDKAASITTMPMVIGVRFTNILLKVLIIIEPFLFTTMLLLLVPRPLFTIITMVILVMIIINSIITNDEPYKGRFFLASSYRNLYDPFYQAFWPIILILGLSYFYNIKWLFLLIIHSILFIGNAQSFFQKVKSWSQWVYGFSYQTGHWTGKKILLLFGVDIDARNISVIDYFKSIISFKKR